jgi:small ubiquitin-related modifier
MSDSDICSDDEKYGGIGFAMANSLQHQEHHIASARSRDHAFPVPGTQLAAPTAVRTAPTAVRAAEENKQIIMICVKDQTGEVTMIKMYNSSMMSKVFSAYEKIKGVEKASFRFLLKGERIYETDTPKILNLDDKDQIDCVLAEAEAEEGGRWGERRVGQRVQAWQEEGGRGEGDEGMHRDDHNQCQRTERGGDHVQQLRCGVYY